MKFYYGSGSPFAWRVHLALEEKGLPYEANLLSFQAGDLKKPEYLKISPHGKVPALVDGETSVYESQAILEYLEERYPEKPLLPATPQGRALVRMEELECLNYFATAFTPLARHIFSTPADKRDPKLVEEGGAELRRQLELLEARVSARGGAFMCGAALTRADLTWLPYVELPARAGFELDPARTPWVAKWRERMRSRPSYEKTYPPHWRK